MCSASSIMSICGVITVAASEDVLDLVDDIAHDERCVFLSVCVGINVTKSRMLLVCS